MTLDTPHIAVPYQDAPVPVGYPGGGARHCSCQAQGGFIVSLSLSPPLSLPLVPCSAPRVRIESNVSPCVRLPVRAYVGAYLGACVGAQASRWFLETRMLEGWRRKNECFLFANKRRKRTRDTRT